MAHGSATLDTSRVLYRAVPVSVRGIDADKRTATFVASTENPVDTFWGREVLRMNGVDLTRFQGGGPFLDAHDGSSIDNVLGSGEAKVVGRELEFVAEFDTEGKGARAWGLVQRGHVRTVSIGYRIDPASVLRLKEGQSDGEGPAQVRGPANVVRRWELLEVSLVPVPADRDAQLRAVNPYHSEGRMADQKDQAASATTDAGKPESKSVYAAGVTILPGSYQLADSSDSRGVVAAGEDADDVRARKIRTLAPRDLADLADDLVLEGVTVEEARKRFLAARTERSKPQGTPEAPPVSSEKRTPAPKSMPAEITDEVLVRSFKNAF